MKFFSEDTYLHIYKKNNNDIRAEIDRELKIYKLSQDPGYINVMILNEDNNTNNNFCVKICMSRNASVNNNMYTNVCNIKTNYMSKLCKLLYLYFNYANITRLNKTTNKNENEWFNFKQVLEYNKFMNDINNYITNRVDKYKKKFNLNTCSFEELCKIPFINETRAYYIINYRNRYGKFTRIQELLNINGIGDCVYDQIFQNVYID